MTKETVKCYIRSLSLYKAPGIDGIPNIVLQCMADIISPHLSDIYMAALKRGWYFGGWQKSITCVLQKPGKPSYKMPKAYRPIALLSIIDKLLLATVAADIFRLIEKHSLLPKTHFGGQQGMTTTDTLHYLAEHIKSVWRKEKVVMVLFLDIEAAFHNAVIECLIHNMHKRCLSKVYVQLVQNMLTGRTTRLKFDDFMSKSIDINNGIEQGCPLSMSLYIVYNTDLIELANSNNKDTLGYIDDIGLYLETTLFKKMVKMTEDIME